MTEAQIRLEIVAVLEGWEGAREGDDRHRYIIDTYNAIRPLPRGVRMSYAMAWCAAAVSAAASVAGHTDIIPPECSCNEMISLFKSHPLSKWREDEDFTPQPGDVAFYDWDDTGAPADNAGAADHVGVVAEVRGSTFYVIEGNYSDSVKRREMRVNGKYLRGFGLPAYRAKATPSPPIGGTGEAAALIARLESEAGRLAGRLAAIEALALPKYKAAGDVPDWGLDAVKDAHRRGILKGVADGDFGLSYNDLRVLAMSYRRERAEP